MVNHLLETIHLPLSSSALSLCVSAADPAFHSSPFFTSLHHYLLTSSFPYTLPSSVSRKSFVCHSYENTRGCGGILPISELVTRHFYSGWGTTMSNSIVVGGMHGTACSASQPRGPLGPRHGLELRQVGIRHRPDQQSQQQAKRLPANDRYRNRSPLLRTGSDADSYRDQSGDDGKRGHQNGPQANAVRFQDRISRRHAFGAQSIGVIRSEE